MTAERIEPVWIESSVALAVHDRQLAEHGGGVGLRDGGGLEAALARPRHQWEYGEDDRCALAAAYPFAIARNHPFVDSNTRTAWVMARLFLALNAVHIRYRPEEAIRTMIALAAGELSEAELADWFRTHAAPAT